MFIVKVNIKVEPLKETWQKILFFFWNKNIYGKVWSVNCWQFTFFTTFRVYLNHSLPRKNMEQCRLCHAKLWSNANFASQIHGSFILFPAEYGAMQTLLCKIMEQCRLFPANSWFLHSFPRRICNNADFALQNYGAMQTLPRERTKT